MLGSEIKARFTGNFKDGQLFHQLVEAGGVKHELLPGTIQAESIVTISRGIFERVKNSGGEIEIVEERLIIPPSTRAEPVDNPPDLSDGEEYGEPIELDDLDMSAHALKLAKEKEIDPVALYDQFGDNPIMKGDIQSFILNMEN